MRLATHYYLLCSFSMPFLYVLCYNPIVAQPCNTANCIKYALNLQLAHAQLMIRAEAPSTLASLTEPRKRGLIDFLRKKRSFAKGMWKAIVENASRLRTMPYAHPSALRTQVSHRRGFLPGAYMAYRCPLGSRHRMQVEMSTAGTELCATNRCTAFRSQFLHDRYRTFIGLNPSNHRR